MKSESTIETPKREGGCSSRACSALAIAVRSMLDSMQDFKHPDGHYTLGETGHFQEVRRKLDAYEHERQNAEVLARGRERHSEAPKTL